MDASALIALASLCVALLGALVGVVWRGGTLVAELKEAVKTVREGLEAVRKGLDALAQIPLIAQRLGTVENLVLRIQSDHKALSLRVQETREKVASIHDGESQ